MTRERREEVVLIALVASIAVHVGLMVLIRSQIMTRPLPSDIRSARRSSMRVTERPAQPDPVRIASVTDVAARKDAPAIVPAAAPTLTTAPSAEAFKAEVPSVEAPVVQAPVQLVNEVFDAQPVGAVASPASVQPILRIETPKASALAAPTFTVTLPPAGTSGPVATPSVSAVSAPDFAPAKLSGIREPQAAFTPAKEVYEKVDAQVVAEEKKAVRTLVEQEKAEELPKFVNLVMTASEKDGWRYFKVRVVPRTSLQVIPKDVVLVIDGSGSIGKDRFGRCRRIAQRIMRTAMNSGDRFNLVVFRNAFSYAFRSWRDCDAASLAAGDAWLNRQSAHGRTDVFSTISSVLTLPRDPKRPLVALVVTDGDANYGVSDTAEILSKFTALNDGLVSVYMYGVKSSANRELIDVLTHGNRGESFIFEGWRWEAGTGMEELSERFRDPVLSDLRIVFATGTPAESYPRLLRNLYRGETLSFVGRVPARTQGVAFSLKGINGAEAYEGFFKLPFATAANDPEIVAEWSAELEIDQKLRFNR